MSDSHDNNQLVKQYLNESNDTSFNPELSLNKALKAAKAKTATRDVFSLFTSWVWVVFAGFGASVHSEINKHKHQAHSKGKTSKAKTTQVSTKSKKQSIPTQTTNK